MLVRHPTSRHPANHRRTRTRKPFPVRRPTRKQHAPRFRPSPIQQQPVRSPPAIFPRTARLLARSFPMLDLFIRTPPVPPNRPFEPRLWGFSLPFVYVPTRPCEPPQHQRESIGNPQELHRGYIRNPEEIHRKSIETHMESIKHQSEIHKKLPGGTSLFY